MIKRLIDDSTVSNYRKYKNQSRDEQNVENKVSADIEKNNDVKKENKLDLLTIDEACEILKVKNKTLEKWRIFGNGPKYVKLTARLIRYRLQDIEEFINQKTIQNTGQRP